MTTPLLKALEFGRQAGVQILHAEHFTIAIFQNKGDAAMFRDYCIQFGVKYRRMRMDARQCYLITFWEE